MAPLLLRAADALQSIPDTFSRLPKRVSSIRLERRQNSGTGDIGIIPPSYQGNDTSLAPGAIAGIVLGSVLGFLLITALIFWATQSQANGGIVEEEVVVRRPRSRSPRGSRRSRRSSHRDMEEFRRGSRSYSPRRPPRTQIVEERIVEERIPIRASRGPSPMPMPPPGPPPPLMRETVIVEDRRPRRHSRDDEVIVIEDESDFSSIEPRHQRRRSGRNSGGYRY